MVKRSRVSINIDSAHVWPVDWTVACFSSFTSRCLSGYSDGAGVEGGHCQSHDDEAAAVLLENGPHHCGPDEQGQPPFIALKQLLKTHWRTSSHSTANIFSPTAGFPACLWWTPWDQPWCAACSLHHGDLCGPLLPGVCHHQTAERRLSLQVSWELTAFCLLFFAEDNCYVIFIAFIHINLNESV